MARDDDWFDKISKGASIYGAKKAADSVEELTKLRKQMERSQRQEERDREQLKKMQAAQISIELGKLQEEQRRTAIVEAQIARQQAQDQYVSVIIGQFYELDNAESPILNALILHSAIKKQYDNIEKPDNKQRLAEIRIKLRQRIEEKRFEILPEIISEAEKLRGQLKHLDTLKNEAVSQLNAGLTKYGSAHIAALKELIKVLSSFKNPEFLPFVCSYFGTETWPVGFRL